MLVNQSVPLPLTAGLAYCHTDGDLPASRLRHFAKGEAIFFEGDRAADCYRVMSGAVRSCKLLGDGRRHILAFHIVDEVFGLEYTGDHSCTAEAIKTTTVSAFFQHSPQGGLASGAWPAAALADATLLNLQRARFHTLVLARMLATERVAAFLLDVAERMKSDAFELPMSRADIGDYLGLTIETVSRTLSQLATDGVIRMPSGKREVILLKKELLARLQAGTERDAFLGHGLERGRRHACAGTAP